MWIFGEIDFYLEILKSYLIFEMRGATPCSNRRMYGEGTRDSVIEDMPMSLDI